MSLLAGSSLAGAALTWRQSAAAGHRAAPQPAGRLLVSADGMSRVGKVAVPLPDKVTVAVDGQTVKVKGPKGELAQTLSPLIIIAKDDKAVRLDITEQSRQANMQHGLARSLVSNMVVGVSSGFSKTLSLVGVGYRAAVAGKTLTLSLGYSHPVEMAIPAGLDVKVEKNTTVTVSGSDRCLVGQFAADVRSKREPEPYKGKGVRYAEEVVRKKEGKRGK